MTEPRRLGKYEILEEIGRGGFATVYKARDTTLDRIVALKILHPHVADDHSFIQRFRQEARTAANLRHPNIVTVYEVDEQAGQHYLAMTFLPGQPLDKQLAGAKGLLSLDQTIAILEQIASALDYIHKRGLVHRDVKPSNIIVNDEGQVTLLDFGIVRAADGTPLTTTGAVMGTPQYMSPEQAEGAEIDTRSDVYSLGVVAYQMCTGQAPFDAVSPLVVLRLHADKPPPPPRDLNPQLPVQVGQVLLKALAKKRDERYQRAGELARALRHAVEAEARARQQEERLTELYAQLKQAVADRDWPAVEAHCRQILALEPEYQDVPELWMRVREARARQRELEKLYRRAQAQARSGSWADVQDLCQRIEVLERGYRDTAQLLEQAKEKLCEAQAQKERQARLDQLYTQAHTALQRERWEKARQRCADIESLAGPGYRDVGELLKRAEAGLRRKQAEQQVEKERQAHLAQLYTQLQTAVARKDWAEVLTLGGRIQAQDDSYRDVPKLIERAREQLRRPSPRIPIPAWGWWVGTASLIVLVLLCVAVTLGPQLWEFFKANIALIRTLATEPALTAGATKTRPADDMVMVYAPGSTFQMGSDESDSDAYSNEFPQHAVTLDAFWIDQTEVTNTQYALCVADGECDESALADDTNYNGDHYPVVGVSWYDVDTYCKWVGAQLPTEAQWEYAARGEQGFIYPWGDEFDCSRGNFDDETEFNDYVVPGGEGCDGYVMTAPVGSFPAGASWCGARDMAGNVWEWVADWHGEYPSEAQTNPTGPTEGDYKVLRGGSFVSVETYFRASTRRDGAPVNRSVLIGFRCVAVAPGQ